MSDSRSIVITGSTRGIGYGLAESFLALGCRVAVSGRRAESVEQARATLAAKHSPDRVFGFPCDVRCRPRPCANRLLGSVCARDAGGG